MSQSKGRFQYYEGLFLIGAAQATNLAEVVQHIDHILERANAEVLAMGKWDERRLAYEINKQKRGLYILTYFGCDPVSMDQLIRDSNLSDIIARSLFVRADHLTKEEMQAMNRRQELLDEARLRVDSQASAAEPVASGAE
jgi:small subunit ribosomal protein S6